MLHPNRGKTNLFLPGQFAANHSVAYLDVCVVVDKLNDESDSVIMEIAWLIGFENDVIISTVTYSKEEFEDGPCSESDLVQSILGYGIAA